MNSKNIRIGDTSENMKEKRERIVRKYKEACERKRAHIVVMEERMRDSYKKRTGLDAVDFSVI